METVMSDKLDKALDKAIVGAQLFAVAVAVAFLISQRVNHHQETYNAEAWHRLATKETNSHGQVTYLWTNWPPKAMEQAMGITPGVSDDPGLPVGSRWVCLSYLKSLDLTVPHCIGVYTVIGVRSNFVETLDWVCYDAEWIPKTANPYFTDKSIILGYTRIKAEVYP